MTVSYDPEADVLCFRLTNQPIDEGDELEPGVIVSYDQQGRVVSIEILHASSAQESVGEALSALGKR
jgi:uncharacterized protein YuzE